MRDISSPLDGFSSPFGPQRNRTLQSLLFGQTEPGFTFEPWDITTLYQDRAGTTPVTAAGQSVGLRLDKSQGLAIGPELVTNGDFSTNITGWTADSNTTISWDAGRIKITNIGTAFGYVYQSFPTVIGKTYKISANIYVGTAGTVYLRAGISAGGLTYFDKSTTIDGVLSGVFVATATTSYVHVLNTNVTDAYSLADNISVRELAGNHQVAVSDAKRGVYGWMPKTGKRNLLTYTEQFDNAIWAKDNASITANFADAPDGTISADRFSSAGGPYPQVYQVATLSAGVTYTFSVWVKSDGTDQIAQILLFDGATASFTPNGTWTRVQVTKNGTLGGSIAVLLVTLSDAAPASSFLIWGAQLEVGSTATAYQRVVSQYDITEAGVPTCYYVQADGVDDAYVTPTITPGTDKVQVFAGVRKLSDAAAGVLVEHSTSAGSNSGAFYLTAPDDAVNLFRFISRGTNTGSASSSTSFAAPTTRVISGIGDISGDRSTLRVNGTQVAQSTTDQGTGNFLAYPLYIYARAGTSLPFNGLDFGHAVRFGPNLDASTIARVEALIARNTPEVTL